jgi:hypothetical protein
MSTSGQPPTALTYGYEGDRQYGLLYRHSGRVTLRGTLLAAVAGLAAAVASGVIYAYADLYIPLVYLNIALCMGFGAAVGGLAALVMRWGKVRNLPVALAIVGVLTCVAYYVCWVTWVCAVWDRFVKSVRPFGSLEVAMHPTSILWPLIVRINEVGTWSMGSASSSTHVQNTTGIMLWVFWGVEAAAIFICSFAMAKFLIAGEPFCERCEAWCSKGTVLVQLGWGDKDEIAYHLKAHDLSWLATLGMSDGTRWIEFQHHECSRCNQLHTITASAVKMKKDKRGKATVTRKGIVKKLLVSPEEVQTLKMLYTIAA